MHTGFIGAGFMGHGMAACLLAGGHRLTVLGHRNREPVDDLLSRGAAEAADAVDLAASGAGVIFMCLPNSEVVEATVASMEPELAPGTVLVDATTALPDSTRALEQRLGARGVAYVDAPITGGPALARSGELTSLVGARESVLATVQPLLECYSRSVLHMGPPGAGHTAKLLTNLVSNSAAALLAEAFTVAREVGVDWEKLHRAMLGGAARSGTLEKMITPALSGDYRGHAFAIANAEKDVRYYCTFREGLGGHSAIACAVQGQLAGLCERGLGQRLFSELLDPRLQSLAAPGSRAAVSCGPGEDGPAAGERT